MPRHQDTLLLHELQLALRSAKDRQGELPNASWNRRQFGPVSNMLQWLGKAGWSMPTMTLVATHTGRIYSLLEFSPRYLQNLLAERLQQTTTEAYTAPSLQADPMFANGVYWDLMKKSMRRASRSLDPKEQYMVLQYLTNSVKTRSLLWKWGLEVQTQCP